MSPNSYVKGIKLMITNMCNLKHTQDAEKIRGGGYVLFCSYFEFFIPLLYSVTPWALVILWEKY